MRRKPNGANKRAIPPLAIAAIALFAAAFVIVATALTSCVAVGSLAAGGNSAAYVEHAPFAGEVGLAYASESDGASVKLIVGTLADTGEDEKSPDTRLGMTLIVVENDLMYEKNLVSDFGLYVTAVEKGSSADKAGIGVGDVLAKADGIDLVNMDDLDFALERARRGSTVVFQIESGRTMRTLEAIAEDLASDRPEEESRVESLLNSRRSAGTVRTSDNSESGVPVGQDFAEGESNDDDDASRASIGDGAAGDPQTSSSASVAGEVGDGTRDASGEASERADAAATEQGGNTAIFGTIAAIACFIALVILVGIVLSLRHPRKR